MDADYHNQRVNQFCIRATGGVRHDLNNSGCVEFYDNDTDLMTTSTGAHLTVGGSWANSSDAGRKKSYTQVDGAELLDKLAQLQIRRWNYKAEGADVQHIGPTAPAFRAVFGLGSDDKTISTIDPAGIALAAIQELHRQNKALQAQNDELVRRVEVLEGR
jgi:hypothetical protein